MNKQEFVKELDNLELDQYNQELKWFKDNKKWSGVEEIVDGVLQGRIVQKDTEEPIGLWCFLSIIDTETSDINMKSSLKDYLWRKNNEKYFDIQYNFFTRKITYSYHYRENLYFDGLTKRMKREIKGAFENRGFVAELSGSYLNIYWSNETE